MEKFDTQYLKKCNNTLKLAYQTLNKHNIDTIEYEIYRSAIIKEFEIILEQSGKLLKKVLREYFHSNKEADKLTFKDIFRYAGVHSLMTLDEVQRWIKYRDSRNCTAHDYGVNFANSILDFIDQFIKDTTKLIKIIDDFKR
jgi:nucleotidyltransferase substrate binding protein (TIGR01987 family)